MDSPKIVDPGSMPEESNDSTATTTITVPSPRRILKALAVVVPLLVAVAVAGFFVGQGTRKSDDQVAREKRSAATAAVAIAVPKAVRIAVDRKGAEDKAKRLRIMERAERKLKSRHRVVLRRVVRKLKKSGDRKAQLAYTNGSSAGYSTGREDGHEAGVQDGIVTASDQLTCSDDPDVAFLPYC